MASTRGGARPNAGRKKKPLADKLSDDVYKKKVKVLKFDDKLSGEEMPEPSEYLSQRTKGASENIGKEVYKKTWEWLKARGCEKLINPQTLEQYAMSVARWIQAENAVHTFGFLAKHPTTDMPIASPFVKIGQDFLKQSTNLWMQIYQIVKENCTESFSKDDLDPMSILLNSQPVNGNT